VKGLRRAWFIGLFCLVGSLGVAQQPVSTGTGRQIVLDAVVTDKSGKTVGGLGEQDFTILDNGKPSKVLSFQALSSPVSNAAANADPGASGEVIVVIDEVNTPYEKAWFAREGVKKFLTQNGGALAHPVSLGILSDSGLQVQTQPSIDGNAMSAALGDQKQSMRSIGQAGTGVYGAEDKVRLSLDALESLIAQEKGKPGKKMVIWVSPGWPLLSGFRQLSQGQMQHIYDNVARMSSELRDARMTLYSVDPLSASGVETDRFNYYQNFTKGLTKPANAELGDLGLQVLAVQTGGQAIYGGTPIQNSLDKCVADLNASYVLTIEAAPPEKGSEFHAIEVKVATPGLKVRTRNGYYTQP
jgi:VWFA-related protein